MTIAFPPCYTISPSLHEKAFVDNCPKCGSKGKYSIDDNSYYCSSCGIPFHIRKIKFRSYRFVICGENPGNPAIGDDYKRCFDCGSVNDLSARYCRVCGKQIDVHSIDANEHEWVDLGLSVIWSTKNLQDLYRWKDSLSCETVKKQRLMALPNNDYIDIVSKLWKGSWRLPTKEEFQELVDKCKWEKTFIYNNDYFKKIITGFNIIGPSGASIFIPTTPRKKFLSSFRFTGIKGSDNTLFTGRYWTSCSKERYSADSLVMRTDPTEIFLEISKFKSDFLKLYFKREESKIIDRILNNTSSLDQKTYLFDSPIYPFEKILDYLFIDRIPDRINLGNRIVEEIWMNGPTTRMRIDSFSDIENTFAAIRPVKTKDL